VQDPEDRETTVIRTTKPSPKSVEPLEDSSLSFLPHTGEGPRRKLAPTASTALSRMLAKQKGSKRVQEEDIEEDLEDEIDVEARAGWVNRSSEGVKTQKGKESKRSAERDEAPLDPSIMGGAFGSGRSKKAERDEEQEIAWLEWKLGKKGAKTPTDEGDESDGLDGTLAEESCQSARY
jgi:hypothetical protein